MDEAFIKNKVDSGCYSNVTELVRDAVRRMREEDEKREQLLAALRSREDRIARDETVGYTSGLLNRLAEEAVQNALKKKPIKNAIKP